MSAAFAGKLLVLWILMSVGFVALITVLRQAAVAWHRQRRALAVAARLRATPRTFARMDAEQLERELRELRAEVNRVRASLEPIPTEPGQKIVMRAHPPPWSLNG